MNQADSHYRKIHGSQVNPEMLKITVFESITECIEFPYMEKLYLIYDSFMAETEKFGLDPLTYKEAMKMPEARHWEEALPPRGNE